MKYIFACCLVLLAVASFITLGSFPDTKSDKPILYWVTDPNPARIEQVASFSNWLKKNDYPDIEVRIDTANGGREKVTIQAVSGVCGDIIGHCGGANMRFYNAVGILTDLDQPREAGLPGEKNFPNGWAKGLNFDLTETYEAMGPELSVNDKQFAFPCNVDVRLLWVNKKIFKENDLPLPPVRWTIEEFEKQGKQFVEKMNIPGQPRKYFFVNNFNTYVYMRSKGLGRFNETMTECILDDPRMAETLKLRYKWTFEDHLLPSLAESQSFSTEGGFGGGNFQLLNTGNYAMLESGRWALVSFRKFGIKTPENPNAVPMNLKVVEHPFFEYPNCIATTRAAAIYAGGERKEYAKYFLSFLAGKDYNMNIVHDGDALPPNPKYTDTLAYKKPLPALETKRLFDIFGYTLEEEAKVRGFLAEYYNFIDNADRSDVYNLDYPIPPKAESCSQEKYEKIIETVYNPYFESLLDVFTKEWECHEPFSNAIIEMGAAYDSSPFVLDDLVFKYMREAEDKYMANLISAEEAVREMEKLINKEISRTLQENAALKVRYEELTKLQNKIDAAKAAGKKIPLEWIKNPFHRRYYKFKGMVK